LRDAPGGEELRSGAIARAILYAIEQPDDVSVSEMIVRPTNEQ
jgi:NADP-dependent 3-hydroxy acid dehydrogenase YdfG